VSLHYLFFGHPVCVLTTVLIKFGRFYRNCNFVFSLFGRQNCQALSLSGRLPLWQINTLCRLWNYLLFLFTRNVIFYLQHAFVLN